MTNKQVYLFAEMVVAPRSNFADKEWKSDADWELATGVYYENMTKPSAKLEHRVIEE